MPKSDLNYLDKQSFVAEILKQEKGHKVIAYQNCKNYPGMVLVIMIVFDVSESKYILDLQWEALGLDFYGDTLNENYEYQFESLDTILDYLESKYQLKVTDIPIKLKIGLKDHPNPIDNKEDKNTFEAAWNRFQTDFNNDLLLDRTLKLTYSSKE